MIAPERTGAVMPEERRGRDWRSVWGWSATSAPVGFLLTAGMALGPRGINLLSASAMPFLMPIVPVALAALGVLVGLNLAGRRAVEGRIVGTATGVAAVTMGAVSVGVGLLAWTSLTLTESIAHLAIMSGICAASSLILPAGLSLEPRSHTTRIIEAGVLMPILAGGVMVAWLRTGTPTAALTLLFQGIGVTLALATAGWLVLTRASSHTEERVFGLSALLLIGGAADALALSALLGGLIAGVFWRYAGGRPRDTISRDVLFVQHPLLVMVLLVAGARVDFSLLVILLGLLYAALRTVGTLAASTIAPRLGGLRTTRDMAAHLARPGVFGVALALNAAGDGGEGEASLLLAMVVVGTITSEMVALLFLPRSTEP